MARYCVVSKTMSDRRLSFDNSIESGHGSLSVSLEYVHRNSEVISLRKQIEIYELKISSFEIVLRRHQQKLSEQDHELAKAKTREKELKKLLMRKDEEIERSREQFEELIRAFDKEKKLLKKEVENVGLQKERVIAKGKESELALEKLRSRPLEDELKRERRRANEGETRRRSLEQRNRELEEQLNDLVKEEHRNLEEFKRSVKKETEQRDQADQEKGKLQEKVVSELEESLKLRRRADEQIEDQTAALRSAIMSDATTQSCYHSQDRDRAAACCAGARSDGERRGSGVCLKDPAWEQNLRPHFREIVDVLKIDSLLDRLYSESLITVEEYRSLSQKPEKEKERNRALLMDILPSKGFGSFEKFCNILRQDETAAMQRIADIISKS